MGKIARSSRRRWVRTPPRQASGGRTSKVRETRAATPNAKGALADLAVQLHQRAWATQLESVGMDAGLRLAIEARVADFSATLRGLVQSGAYFQATGMFARDSEAELQFLRQTPRGTLTRTRHDTESPPGRASRQTIAIV